METFIQESGTKDFSHYLRKLEKPQIDNQNDYWKRNSISARYVGGNEIFYDNSYDIKGYKAYFVINSLNDANLWKYFNEKGQDTLRRRLKSTVQEKSNGRLIIENLTFEKGSIRIVTEINDYMRFFNNVAQLAEAMCEAVTWILEEVEDFFSDFSVQKAIQEVDADAVSTGAGLLAGGIALMSMAALPAVLIGGATYVGVKSFFKKKKKN